MGKMNVLMAGNSKHFICSMGKSQSRALKLFYLFILFIFFIRYFALLTSSAVSHKSSSITKIVNLLTGDLSFTLQCF